jgi:hypothetical protein
MANDPRTSDSLNWQLAGIRSERKATQERLTYLEAEEKRLMGNGLLGAKSGATAPNKDKGGKRRRRQMSEETRKKMSEASKKRWAARKVGAETSQAAAVPPSVVSQ